MDGYKHIETSIARFIAARYQCVAEVGAGGNTHAAELILRSGVHITCTDIRHPDLITCVPYIVDDVRSPDLFIYQDVECLYAIRPVEEMMRPLLDLSQKIGSDLYVYHLGFEGYNAEHRIINCGVPLHQYNRRSVTPRN